MFGYLTKPTKIHKVYLSENVIYDRGLSGICKSIETGNFLPTVLKFAKNRLTCYGVESLIDAFSKYGKKFRLKELDLSNNNLTSKGANAICLLLYENQCLQNVDISKSDRPLDYKFKLKVHELCKKNKNTTSDSRR
jgi:Ran GTPase-activating protein (RanGAP) involved in mRNA processing and transport